MPRYLHTQIYVDDLAASIDFYTRTLGLRLLRGPVRTSNGNVEIAFVGNDPGACIELMHDPERRTAYEHGTRYGHLAIEIDGSLDAVLAELRSKGVRVVLEPWRGSSGRTIAMIEEPLNRVQIELFEPAAAG